MTLPASGPISMSQINTEFALGNNLGAHRGVRWYLANAGTGTFPSTNISFNDFYSKRKTSPVTPGSVTITSTQVWTPPLYSILSVAVYSGSGGGAGGSGNVIQGNNGSAGTASRFGVWGTGDYGRGGLVTGVDGANGSGANGTVLGGAGGAAAPGGVTGGDGGQGGRLVLSLTNPVNGGTGPTVGSPLTVTIGSGGAGGAGGSSNVGGVYFYAGSGEDGNNGRVIIAWA